MNPLRDPSKPKVCSCCGVERPPSGFHLQRGLLRSQCIECLKAKRLLRKDRERATSAEWVKKNPEKAKARWSRNHESRKEKRNEYSRQWQKKNRHLVRAFASKRRAIKAKATPLWDLELTELAVKEASHLAEMRFRSFGFEWHVDHMIPLNSTQVCGLHVWSNIQVIPASVNVSKGNRVMHIERFVP